MPQSLRDVIRQLLEDIGSDVVEERVVNYIVRELRLHRPISEILNDPYVKNRIREDRLGELLQSKELLAAVERELSESMRAPGAEEP